MDVKDTLPASTGAKLKDETVRVLPVETQLVGAIGKPEVEPAAEDPYYKHHLARWA
ncbi:hypothetical protein HDU85_003896 [Gaertneriomyces sp. JEL0708]|nr:hypothetical protein HDU85_003896 [Gaertneriomyces sp. JEL0708]